MELDAQTRLVALLGYPIEHSLSPLIHNTAFRQQGLNRAYVATPVPPDHLTAAVAGLKALGFAGANVTLPHKQAVRPLMDELSPRAEAVGAVNTIVCQREGAAVRLYGDNTDVAGFLKPLQPHAGALQGAPVLIFGSGGAARAVAYAVLSTFRPCRLVFAVRSPHKAERLAQDLAPYDEANALDVVPLSEAGSSVRASTLLVNATPLGMHPHREGTPWEETGDFSGDQMAYDLVYNPEETRFLRETAAQGVTSIGGLDMLVEQAAASYRQWTGRDMPTEVVHEALRRREM